MAVIHADDFESGTFSTGYSNVQNVALTNTGGLGGTKGIVRTTTTGRFDKILASNYTSRTSCYSFDESLGGWFNDSVTPGPPGHTLISIGAHNSVGQGGAFGSYITLTVIRDNPSDTISYVRIGHAFWNAGGGVVGATFMPDSDAVVPIDSAHHRFRVAMRFSSSLGATDGDIVVYVDETEILRGSNLNFVSFSQVDIWSHGLARQIPVNLDKGVDNIEWLDTFCDDSENPLSAISDLSSECPCPSSTTGGRSSSGPIGSVPNPFGTLPPPELTCSGGAPVETNSDLAGIDPCFSA